MLNKAINSWLDGYRKIFCYSGRSTRSEFGFFILIQFIIFILTIIIVSCVLGRILPEPIIGFFVFIIFIVNFLVILSYNVRRLHDAGASGWWCLTYLFCAAIMIGASIAMKPTPGENQYGPDPRT